MTASKSTDRASPHSERSPRSARRKSIRADSNRSGRLNFQNVFSKGERVRGGAVNVLFCERGDQALSRWGVAIGRKYGTAVARNRVRRMARENIRNFKELYPSGYDLILEILSGCNRLGRREVNKAMTEVLKKCAALLARSPQKTHDGIK